MSLATQPIELLDIAVDPLLAPQSGFISLYYKNGYLTSLYPTAIIKDVVLDRPLDNFISGTAQAVVAVDTVLEAFQKLQGTFDNVALIGDVTGVGVYNAGTFEIACTIVASAVNIDITDGITTETVNDGETITFSDTASVNLTVSAVNTISAVVIPGGVDHDLLSNFVANEHIDHTSVTLTAGVGLSGGGDISANRTFDLDIPSLPALTDGGVLDAADTFAVYNASVGAHEEVTFAQLGATLGVPTLQSVIDSGNTYTGVSGVTMTSTGGVINFQSTLGGLGQLTLAGTTVQLQRGGNGLIISPASMQITDVTNSKGLQYTANYDAVGILDPNWIPSYRAVQAYADSLVTNNGIYDGSDNLTVDTVVSLSDGAAIDYDLTFASLTEAAIMHIDSTNNRIGFGTTVPGYPLHFALGDAWFQNGSVGIGGTPPDAVHKFRVSTVNADGNNYTGARIDIGYDAATGAMQGLQVRSLTTLSGGSSTLYGVNSNITGSASAGVHTIIAGRFRAAKTQGGTSTVNNYALQLEDGTEGTVGHVWTSDTITGHGHWADPSTLISGFLPLTGGTMSGSIVQSVAPTLGTHLTNKDYVDSLVQGIDWKESIISEIDFTSAEPGAPSTGQRYINTATGVGSVTAQAVTLNYIYEWNGTDWTEIAVNEGATTRNETTDVIRHFDGTNWINMGGAISHNGLTGLQGGAANEYYHLTAAQHVIAIQSATTSLSGYLSSTDWTTFNAKVSGSGTTDYVSKWTASGVQGDSIIQDDGSTIGVGTAPLSFVKASIQSDLSVVPTGGMIATTSKIVLADIPAGNATASLVGFLGVAEWNQTTIGQSLTKDSSMKGGTFQVILVDQGTVSFTEGIDCKVVAKTANGVIDSFKAYNADIADSNLGTINNFYGLYIPNLTTAGGTLPAANLRYGVYQQDAGNNYFAGTVGIGVIPGVGAEALTVNGSVKITDGSQALDRVLTSDATGVGTWTDLSAVLALETSDISLHKINTPTISTLDSYIDNLGSTGLVSGGVMSNNGDGTITVSTGEGFIRDVDTDSSHVYACEWATNAVVALTDNSVNYIYLSYVSTVADPVVTVSTTRPADLNTNILIGSVYRSGNEVHLTHSSKYYIPNFVKNLLNRMTDTAFFAHANGALLSETGTRNVAVTAGTFWEALNQIDTISQDTSGALPNGHSFEYFYRDGIGGWTTHEESITAAVFTGVGLDDGTSGGTFIGSHTVSIKVTIDGTGTPDTFKWEYLDNDGVTWVVGATGVNITVGAITLIEGATITFAATTGHTLNDEWAFAGRLSSQIDNTQYDDGTGTLAILGNGRYGVHWAYLDVHGHMAFLFGEGSYTLTNAQELEPPTILPPEFETHARLIGKVIIGKNDAVFTSIENNYGQTFQGSVVTDHANLTGLQGGTAAEYYHLTSAQHIQLTGITATSAEVNLLDLSGLTAGWVLSADTATTASWKAPTGGGLTGGGVTDRMAYWDSATSLNDSSMRYDGVNYSIGASILASRHFRISTSSASHYYPLEIIHNSIISDVSNPIQAVSVDSNAVNATGVVIGVSAWTNNAQLSGSTWAVGLTNAGLAIGVVGSSGGIATTTDSVGVLGQIKSSSITGDAYSLYASNDSITAHTAYALGIGLANNATPTQHLGIVNSAQPGFYADTEFVMINSSGVFNFTNINSLTADATPDGAADYVMTWDNSTSLHKKVLLNNLPGGGGGTTMIDDTLWAVAGDIAYATANDVGAVLSIGTANQVLKVNAGATAPEWVTQNGSYRIGIDGIVTTGAATSGYTLTSAASTNELVYYVDGANPSGSNTKIAYKQFTVPKDYAGNGILHYDLLRTAAITVLTGTAYVNDVVDATINGAAIAPTATNTFEEQTVTFGTALVAGDSINVRFNFEGGNGEDVELRGWWFTYDKK